MPLMYGFRRIASGCSSTGPSRRSGAFGLWLVIFAIAIAAMSRVSAEDPVPAALVGTPDFELIKAPFAGGQVRAEQVAVSPDGVVVMACPSGIALFDGAEWHMVTLPDDMPGSCVAIDTSGTIYAGGMNDVGTIEHDDRMQYVYRSLTAEIEVLTTRSTESLISGLGSTAAAVSTAVSDTKTVLRESGKLLQIVPGKKSVFFAFSQGLLELPKGNTTGDDAIWHDLGDSRIHCCNRIDDRILIGLDGRGFFHFSESKLVPLADTGGKVISGYNDSFLIGCCRYSEKTVLTISYQGGLAKVVGEQVSSFDCPASTWLRSVAAKGLAAIGEDRFIATTESGVVVFDKDGQVIATIGPRDGVGMGVCRSHPFIDHEGMIWIPMIHSAPLAVLDSALAVRRFNVRRERAHWIKEAFGTVITAFRNDIGYPVQRTVTSQDNMESPEQRSILQWKRVDSQSSHSLGSVLWDDELICSSIQGLQIINRDLQLSRVDLPFYLTSPCKVPEFNMLLCGSFDARIQAFRRDETWTSIGQLSQAPEKCVDVLWEPAAGRIWCCSVEPSGKYMFYRTDSVDLESADLSQIPFHSLNEYAVTGFHCLQLWNNRVLLCSSRGLLEYDEVTDSLKAVPLALLSKLLTESDEVDLMAVDAVGDLWLSTSRFELMVISPDGAVTVPRGLQAGDVVSSIFADPAAQNVWVQTTTNRVIRFPVGQREAPTKADVRITQFSAQPVDSATESDRQAVSLQVAAELPESNSAVTMTFACPSFDRMPERCYQYRLVGLNPNWSEWTSATSQAFRSLPAGTYDFQVRARGRDFRIGDVQSIRFSVLPPWYRSPVLMLLYTLLATLMVGLVIRYRTKQATRRVEHLEQLVSQRTQDLSESHDRYRWLVEGLEENYVFFTTDAAGHFSYASPSVRKVLGVEPTSIQGQPWESLIAAPPCDVRFSNGSPPAGNTSTRALVFESAARHHDGSERYLELTRLPQNTKLFTTDERQYLAKDITELRKAQQALHEARDELERRVQERTTAIARINDQLSHEIEDHRQTERQLYESELRYRSIVEDQTEMVIQFRQDGQLLFANRAFRERNGLSPEEVTNFNCLSVIHESDRPRVLERLRRVDRNRPFQTELIRVARHDGSEDWAEWHGRALFDKEGRQLGFQAVGRVVTDLLKAQQRLTESELRYRSVVEDQLDMIVRFDADGNIEFGNGAFMRANALAPSDIPGTNLFSLISEEEQRRLRTKLEKMTPEQPTRVDVARVRRADGTIHWEEWHDRAIYDEKGTLITYQAVGRDITELQHAQDRLQESELRYRSIVEDQQEMIVRMDREGKITFCNGAYAREHGLQPEEVIGRSCFADIHPDDLAEAQQRMFSANREQPFASMEMRVFSPDGSVRWRAWCGRALYDESGELLGYQGVGRDITALREAEARLDEKERQLAHLARVSTLGEMVAGISHEINQPLATIANFSAASQMVLDRSPLAESGIAQLQQWNERIGVQTEKINAIIHRLRRFGQPGSHREECSLREIIDEAVLVTETRTRHSVSSVRIETPADLPTLYADRIQIEQVLVNLIRNACDAMADLNPSERHISITAVEEQNTIRIVVTDTGAGVTDDQVNDIFDAFMTSKSEGMGVGLTISRSIVEAHDGRIRAVPSSSGGQFEVILPCNAEAATASTSATESDPA